MKGTSGCCSLLGGGGGRLVTGMPDPRSAPGCLQLCQREDGVCIRASLWFSPWHSSALFCSIASPLPGQGPMLPGPTIHHGDC